MSNDQTKPTSSFVRAKKAITPLKISIQGISFSGKTMSAIKLAKGLAKGKDVFVIDSENGSAALYDHLDFLHASVRPPFRPDDYIKLIREAVDAGAGAVVIDSGSHAWQYILDYKDQLDTAGGRGAQWSNWAKAKPLWQALKDAILQSPVHVVVCFREAAEYAVDSSDDGRGNKQSRVNKVGTKAKAEEGSEYEFTVAWKLDKTTHLAFVEKDRTGLFDGRSFLIDEAIGHELLQWLGDGDFVTTPEWELLRAGVSDDFKNATEDAEKVRKDQARMICNNRKIGVEVQKLLAAACKEASVSVTQAIIDADRYGATDADRLIRYVCQQAKVDPVPIIRIHTGQEAPRAVAADSKPAAAVETPKAEAKKEDPKEDPKPENPTQAANAAATEATPQTPTAEAPSGQTSAGSASSSTGSSRAATTPEEEKVQLINAAKVMIGNRGWSTDPKDVAAIAGELLNLGAIESIEVLGNLRLQRLIEKLSDETIVPKAAGK